ncbi:MAG: hypothetical protein ABR501_10850 [Pyrinomonadaceae bacterium]
MAESSGGVKKRELDDATQPNQGHDADATSKETLSDIRDSEKASGSSDGPGDPGPSPDGRLDEPDELKDAGPM